MSEIKILGEVANIRGGTGFPEYLQGKPGKIPFIKVSDMNLPCNSHYIVSANNYADDEVIRTLKPTIFPKGTVVFAKVGAAVYLNKRRILTKDTIIDNNMMGVTPHNVDPDFLYHFLLSIDFAEFVQPGALPSINQSILEAILLPDLSVSEQEKVSVILNT
ncbi:MAG: restriction endonuclease subunit S [Endozoicomonas sp.]